MTKAIKIFIYFLAWNSEHYYIYENDVRIRSYYYYTIVTIVLRFFGNTLITTTFIISAIF